MRKYLYFSLMLLIGAFAVFTSCQNPSGGDTSSAVTYTVTFDANGGSAVQAQTIESGLKATMPTDPTKAENTFAGWTLDGSYYDFSTVVTSNITLVASWTDGTTPAATYTVTFNSNGGSSVVSQTIASGQLATKPADPTKANNTFSGWTLNDFDYDFDTPVTSNITLKASWIASANPPGTYTVTFNSNGGVDSETGEDVASQSVYSGDFVTQPNDPFKSGSTFVGWYKDSGLTTLWLFDSDTVTAEMTLYAKWTLNEVDVGTGGITVNNPVTVTVGFTTTTPTTLSQLSSLTITASPSTTVDSYSWYLDGVLITGKTSATITVQGPSMKVGVHNLTVVVKKNGTLFSNGFTFTVQ